MKKVCVYLVLALTSFSFFLPSCGSGSEEGDEEMEDSLPLEKSDSTRAEKAKNVFHSIPSPLETATLLKNTGARYNKDILNPIENADKYNTSSKQGINLGVYGTDLSFTNVFEKSNESMLYLKCVSKLANNMGISAFGEATFDRIEANESNYDSLLNIITEAFWDADAYLKENDRQSTSALIVAGGWIEGLFLACDVAKITHNQEIITRIAEQKLSLNNLIALLKAYPKDDEVNNILTDLNSLKSDYDKVIHTTSETVTSTNNKTGITTIDNGSKIEMSPELLEVISKKIKVIRTRIIKP